MGREVAVDAVEPALGDDGLDRPAGERRGLGESGLLDRDAHLEHDRPGRKALAGSHLRHPEPLLGVPSLVVHGFGDLACLVLRQGRRVEDRSPDEHRPVVEGKRTEIHRVRVEADADRRHALGRELRVDQLGELAEPCLGRRERHPLVDDLRLRLLAERPTLADDVEAAPEDPRQRSRASLAIDLELRLVCALVLLEPGDGKGQGVVDPAIGVEPERRPDLDDDRGRVEPRLDPVVAFRVGDLGRVQERDVRVGEDRLPLDRIAQRRGDRPVAGGSERIEP